MVRSTKCPLDACPAQSGRCFSPASSACVRSRGREGRCCLTSEGSVASNAEKLAKPVLPDTEVLLLPIIAYLLPLDSQTEDHTPDHTPEAHSFTHQGTGCRSCSISHQRTLCKLQCSHLSTRGAHHTSVKT
eukprot:642014-Pelagomonas_calceolata.AAC.1